MTRGASWCGGEREPSCRSLDKREGLWSQGKNPTETFYTCGEKLGKMTVNDFSILLWCLSAGHQTRQNISISITLKTKVTNFRVLNHPQKKWEFFAIQPSPRSGLPLARWSSSGRFSCFPSRSSKSWVTPREYSLGSSGVLGWTVEPSKTWGPWGIPIKKTWVSLDFLWMGKHVLWLFLWIVTLGMMILSNGWLLFDFLCETKKKGGKPIGWADFCQQNLGFN